MNSIATLIVIFEDNSLQVTEFTNMDEALCALHRLKSEPSGPKPVYAMRVPCRIDMNISQILPIGRLNCSTNTEPDYPGFDIEFINAEESAWGADTIGTRPRTLTEYENGVLRTIVWNNPDNENYASTISLPIDYRGYNT